MTTPLVTIAVQMSNDRRASVSRETRETTVTISLDLDGEGTASIDTGVGFFDHLLSSLAHHGLFDLEVRTRGDLGVDEHHSVEDTALVLGAAFAEALGDRAGIVRFTSPEAAAEAAETLLRNGLVPRTFGAGHPLADSLRLTVRNADENDRLIAAASQRGKDA